MTTKKIMVFRSDWNCLTNIVKRARSQLDNGKVTDCQHTLDELLNSMARSKEFSDKYYTKER